MLFALGGGLIYVLLFISLFYQVFMLVAFIEAMRRPRTGAVGALALAAVPDSKLPSVTIVVPCFNEETTVGATIESLLALDYPADKLNIVVVDDGSTDGTLSVAQQYMYEHSGAGANERASGEVGATVRAQREAPTALSPKSSDILATTHYAGEFCADLSACPRVSVFHKENGGKHSAMNYALEHSDSELFGCLDADSVVSPDALHKIVPVFTDERVAAATPAILIKKPGNWLQHMQDAESSLSVFNRFTLAALGAAFITPGPFSIFRTDVVRAEGGWRHGHSTEDLEMALRIQDRGYLIANVPTATVYTGTPHTLFALYRQRVRWTYGLLRNAVDFRHLFWNRSYGNLSFIILPMALVSIGIGVFFFLLILYDTARTLVHSFVQYESVGLALHPTLDPFYLDTSALWIIAYTGVALIVVLIALGNGLGTGKRTFPKGTLLFVALFSFLGPVWLVAAVIRALFKTGVRWR